MKMRWVDKYKIIDIIGDKELAINVWICVSLGPSAVSACPTRCPCATDRQLHSLDSLSQCSSLCSWTGSLPTLPGMPPLVPTLCPRECPRSSRSQTAPWKIQPIARTGWRLSTWYFFALSNMLSALSIELSRVEQPVRRIYLLTHCLCRSEIVCIGIALVWRLGSRWCWSCRCKGRHRSWASPSSCKAYYPCCCSTGRWICWEYKGTRSGMILLPHCRSA